MAKIDKIKEEIGWLKVIFAALTAVDISLVAWLAKHLSGPHQVNLVLTLLGTICVSIFIFAINILVYKKLINWRTYKMNEILLIIGFFTVISSVVASAIYAIVHGKKKKSLSNK